MSSNDASSCHAHKRKIRTCVRNDIGGPRPIISVSESGPEETQNVP